MISQHPPKPERRRHTPISIPDELQTTIRSFAAELTERYGVLFTQDPQMKSRASAMLGRCLPPRPRRSGRPGLANVTAAIRLHDELKRSFPTRPAKEIWQEIYRAIIPRWDSLSRIERRTEADWLWTRVRWRLYARRRKHRKPHT